MFLESSVLDQHNHFQCEIKEHDFCISILGDVALTQVQLVHDADHIVLDAEPVR